MAGGSAACAGWSAYRAAEAQEFVDAAHDRLVDSESQCRKNPNPIDCDHVWPQDSFDAWVAIRNDYSRTAKVATNVGLFGVPAIAAAYLGLLWVVTGSLRRDTRSPE